MTVSPAQLVEVSRFDRASGILSPRVTEEGFLLVTADFAKPGVLRYRHPDGSVTRELVLPEVLHDPKSLATLAMKPVTLEHPAGNVTPETHADTAVGSTGETIEVIEEGGYARVKLVVRDRAAIDSVRAGKVEVSPGYRVKLDATPGVHPEFGAYDAIQRDRRYNHLAITDIARGGPDIRLHLDSAVAVGEEPSNPTREPDMNRALFLALLTAASIAPADVVRADAADADPVSDEEVTRFREALEKRDSAGLKAAFDALMGQYNTLSRQVSQKDGELESLKAQVAALEAAKAAKAAAGGEDEDEEEMDACGMEKKMDAGDGLKAAIAWTGRRSSLMSLAAARGVTIEHADSLGNRDLARKIASAIRSDLRADASDDYVAAVIDLAGTEAPPVADPYAALAFRPRVDSDPDRRQGQDTPSLSSLSLAAYQAAASAR